MLCRDFTRNIFPYSLQRASKLWSASLQQLHLASACEPSADGKTVWKEPRDSGFTALGIACESHIC